MLFWLGNIFSRLNFLQHQNLCVNMLHAQLSSSITSWSFLNVQNLKICRDSNTRWSHATVNLLLYPKSFRAFKNFCCIIVDQWHKTTAPEKQQQLCINHEQLSCYFLENQNVGPKNVYNYPCTFNMQLCRSATDQRPVSSIFDAASRSSFTCLLWSGYVCWSWSASWIVPFQVRTSLSTTFSLSSYSHHIERFCWKSEKSNKGPV